MRLEHRDDNIYILRFMLAELMAKQSSVCLTEAQRELHKKGILALQAAVDALQCQVYA